MLQRDIDPQETREWLEAFEAVVDHDGLDRAQHLLERVVGHAQLDDFSGRHPLPLGHRGAPLRSSDVRTPTIMGAAVAGTTSASTTFRPTRSYTNPRDVIRGAYWRDARCRGELPAGPERGRSGDAHETH
jgi:hypothetical protein